MPDEEAVSTFELTPREARALIEQQRAQIHVMYRAMERASHPLNREYKGILGVVKECMKEINGALLNVDDPG